MTEKRRPGILMVVKFKSSLSNEELEKRYKERIPQFEAFPGLVQKYYIHDPATDEWGGAYVWDSQASLDEYLASDLRKSIPDVYEIVGAPRIEISKVEYTLRTSES